VVKFFEKEPGGVRKMGTKKGKAFKFGDDISTDHIAPGRLFHLRSNLEEFAKHVLEDADPEFASKMQKGDFVVAGNNFGLGSSREHAPQIIKIAGVGAVIAKSFARIFYRNAINIGLLLIECDTDNIDAGDELELDVKNGVLKDITKGLDISITPMPDVMLKLLEDGGLIEHLKKHGDFQLT
jgi:3-isopropylmalate/(R)-2-methylmalate dehydratase small subunit